MNDYKTILSKGPEELLNWLVSSFTVEIPSALLSVEDMQYAAQIMSQLAGYYQYLNSLSAYAKIITRQIKRADDKTKEDYEDMVDKKEAINSIIEAVKMTYNALSRAVTIYIENNKELHLL